MTNKDFAIISKNVYIPMYKGCDLETISKITQFSEPFILELLESEEFKQQLKMFAYMIYIYSIEDENEMMMEFAGFIKSINKYGVYFFYDSESIISFDYVDDNWVIKNKDNKIISEFVPLTNPHLNKQWFLDMVRSWIPNMIECGFYHYY